KNLVPSLMPRNCQSGLSLAEILISLAVLGLGLSLVCSSVPMVLRASSQVEEETLCTTIALNYRSLLCSLPYDCTDANLRERFKSVFGSEGITAENEPVLTPLASDQQDSFFLPPKDMAGVFHDKSAANGEYVVRIAYVVSTAIPARTYAISVARQGNEWKVYPIIVTRKWY
ncbi:MAG: type II secretion system protein, partial [Candidatus Brocadiia bacterium]